MRVHSSMSYLSQRMHVFSWSKTGKAVASLTRKKFFIKLMMVAFWQFQNLQYDEIHRKNYCQPPSIKPNWSRPMISYSWNFWSGLNIPAYCHSLSFSTPVSSTTIRCTETATQWCWSLSILFSVCILHAVPILGIKSFMVIVAQQLVLHGDCHAKLITELAEADDWIFPHMQHHWAWHVNNCFYWNTYCPKMVYLCSELQLLPPCYSGIKCTCKNLEVLTALSLAFVSHYQLWWFLNCNYSTVQLLKHPSGLSMV